MTMAMSSSLDASRGQRVMLNFVMTPAAVRCCCCGSRSGIGGVVRTGGFCP